MYYVFPLLRRSKDNTKLVANEMHDLSARAKFPDARFQSLLLIMSKIVAEIQLLFFQKMERKKLQTTIGTFGGDTSGIKQDWLLR